MIGERKKREREREERRTTCVIKAQNEKAASCLEKRRRAILCVSIFLSVRSYRCVLTRVGPDCGRVQPLYRLTSCVSMLAKSHAETCR